MGPVRCLMLIPMSVSQLPQAAAAGEAAEQQQQRLPQAELLLLLLLWLPLLLPLLLLLLPLLQTKMKLALLAAWQPGSHRQPGRQFHKVSKQMTSDSAAKDS